MPPPNICSPKNTTAKPLWPTKRSLEQKEPALDHTNSTAPWKIRVAEHWGRTLPNMELALPTSYEGPCILLFIQWSKEWSRNKFLVRHFDSFGSLNLCLRWGWNPQAKDQSLRLCCWCLQCNRLDASSSKTRGGSSSSHIFLRFMFPHQKRVHTVSAGSSMVTLATPTLPLKPGRS